MAPNSAITAVILRLLNEQEFPNLMVGPMQGPGPAGMTHVPRVARVTDAYGNMIVQAEDRGGIVRVHGHDFGGKEVDIEMVNINHSNMVERVFNQMIAHAREWQRESEAASVLTS